MYTVNVYREKILAGKLDLFSQIVTISSILLFNWSVIFSKILADEECEASGEFEIPIWFSHTLQRR